MLDAIDLGEVLKEALDEDDTDYKKVAFILNRLSSLERADMIAIVLDHLPRLYPVAHAVNAFFRNVGKLDAKTTKHCARQLLRPILAGKNENAPEFYSMWILDLFRLKPDWNEAASLAKIFRTSQSPAVRRYAALALASTGSRSEAIDLKDAFTGSESLTRSALLLATKKLGADERKHWIRLQGSGPQYASVVAGVPLYAHQTIGGVTPAGTVQWLNPNAFISAVDPSTGACTGGDNAKNCQFGNLGRNALRGPDFAWGDFYLTKWLTLREHVKLRLEAQAFNLFNHPNFALPTVIYAGIPGKPSTQTGFGALTYTTAPPTGLLGVGLGGDSSPRMIAFQARLEF